jgi:HAD superfamily hydrolase (TIGR01484 family)
MRYLALATDYDGTLALHGKVQEQTLRVLEQFVATNRKLFLVTGRELEDLLNIFPHAHLFDWIIAENGAVLYKPASSEIIALANPPSEKFLTHLRARGIPISAGRVISSTVRPHEIVVLEVIRDLGLDTHVIFNKEAVMMLPTGLNKATGLTEALRKTGLSPHNVVGIGDAENDHAFLGICECAVAVGNALPSIKERADMVTDGEQGKGVAELIEQLLTDDLASFDSRLHRHHLIIGTSEEGQEVRISPYGLNVLIAGPSGSGKSTLATGILERLGDKCYQCCIIDPEGDYESLDQAVVLGDMDHAPSMKEILRVLENPQSNLVINLICLPVQDRPGFFKNVYTHLQDFRARTGRPHWIVLDETHHVLPADWEPASTLLTPSPHSMLFITVHPAQVAAEALSAVDAVMVIGKSPTETLQSFSQPLNDVVLDCESVVLEAGEALYWNRYERLDPFRVKILPNRRERRRHRRKYAEGELGPDHSFYFQGPEGKFNLRAHNLMLFLQLAEGIDHDTWMYHLKRHDYSRWFRESIKDKQLAAEVEEIEKNGTLGPSESLAQIKTIVDHHYSFSPRPPSSSSSPSP